ncbi:MAG: hypothetical protein V1915_01300 [Candidatus Bathyarchaeota archaeon]
MVSKTSFFLEKLPWKTDIGLCTEAVSRAVDVVHEKRAYEKYVIFNLGLKLAGQPGIDLVFRSPEEYPDAILIYVGKEGECERALNVEFEGFSSGFQGHDSTACDLIICWVHDWKEKFPNEKCPLPVLELGRERKEKYYPKKE